MSKRTSQSIWEEIYKQLHARNSQLNHAQGVSAIDAMQAWALRVFGALRKLERQSGGLMVEAVAVRHLLSRLKTDLAIYIPAEVLTLIEELNATT